MARDRRRLGPDEEALWGLVKKSVVPLRPEPLPPQAPAADAEQPRPARATAVSPPRQEPPRQPARPAMPTLHTLGRRDRQKLVRAGNAGVDARLDLHGLRQDEAHARLAGFLALAQSSGHKVVLVITGKGRSDGFEALHERERGVLRRVVPLWLSLPEFRRYVLGFEEAHLVHGGAGALYIRIRKRKP